MRKILLWKPDLCVHATICFTELPKVFIPYERPWILMKSASTEKIIDTVCQCPTQALSYFWNNKKQEEMKNEEEKNTEISIIKNGPYIIKGSFKITDIDGNEIVCEKSASLCRCGYTKNRPFCDGSHLESDFKIDDKTFEGSDKR